MPQAIALAAFNAGLPLGVVNAIAGVGVAGAVLHTAVGLTVSVGASYAAGRLLAPGAPKPSDGQIEFKQPIPPRVIHYGRVKVSGPLAFFEVDSIKGLWKIILVSAREIDAFEANYLDDLVATVDGTVSFENVDSIIQDGAQFLGLWTHLGTDTQVADSRLTTQFSGDWTSTHRLRGIAYAVTHMSNVGETDTISAYPNGAYEYKALIRGAKLYDPRLDSTSGGSGSHVHSNKATWTWSALAPLAVLDWLTHADGYNRPIAKMDRASFRIATNLADQQVTLKAGGSEDRYRVATSIPLTRSRSETLRMLLDACDMSLMPTADGTWKIVGGQWIEPTVTLDADQGHILEAEFFGGASALERYNELAITYLSPDHGYQEVEGEPWQNAADIADTGIIETRPFDALQVPSHAQARRLAKIRMARDNPEWVGTVRTNMYGLDAIGERCVNIVWPELEIDGPFWIDELTILGDGTGAVLQVRSADETAYDWNAATEEGTAPPVPPDLTQEAT